MQGMYIQLTHDCVHVRALFYLLWLRTAHFTNCYSRLIHWQRPNRNIFPLLSVKQPWGIWVDISHDSINKLWYNYCYYYTRFQCYCILVPKIWVISSQPHMVFIIPQGQCKWDQIWSISSLVALENIEAWTGSTFCGSKVGIPLVSLFHAHLRLSKYAFGLTYNVLPSPL